MRVRVRVRACERESVRASLCLVRLFFLSFFLFLFSLTWLAILVGEEDAPCLMERGGSSSRRVDRCDVRVF